MAWDRIKQFLFGEDEAPSTGPASPADQAEIEAIAAMAQRMVDVVSQSMRIAFDSKNIDTRRSRIRVARENVARVQKLAADYPFIKIDNIADVERDLDKIDRETDRMAGVTSTADLNLKGLVAENFDVSCDCGASFGVPLSNLEGEFACPECGQVGSFTSDEIAAIRSVVDDAEAKVRRSLSGLMGRPE